MLRISHPGLGSDFDSKLEQLNTKPLNWETPPSLDAEATAVSSSRKPSHEPPPPSVYTNAMPTEGRSQRRHVSAKSSKGGRKTDESGKTETGKAEAKPRKPIIKTEDHHRSDLWGAVLLASALLLGVVLALGRGGLLGDGIVGLMRMAVGGGAWIVAALLGFAGVCLLLGRSNAASGRIALGASLIFLGWLGATAQSRQGDFFDPEAMSQSGGVVGAAVAGSLSALVGSAFPVGIGLLLASGAILCLHAPAHVALVEFGRWVLRKPKPIDAELVDSADEPVRPAALRRQGIVEPDVSQDRKASLRARLQKELEEPAWEESTASPAAPAPAAPKPKAPRFTEAPAAEPALEAPRPSGKYTLPPLSLLAEPAPKPKKNAADLQKNIETLEGTLEQFGVEANVVEVATGPALTRYEIQLGPGIKVNRITNLADNIAMSLAAYHVRVEAPIPGKSAIGVEVPNSQRGLVTLREMCDSLEFHDNQSRLTMALGKDVSGAAKYADLSKMPHLLIGGATNSGKSIGLASIIMSLIVKHTPREVRLVMIDPKRVELSLFEGLPHLMCPVVKDVKEAAGVLRAVWREMDKRYDMFSERQVRNIDGWNSKVDPEEKLPYIVVIIDELADLMIQCRAEVETSICRLAQLARATGIHLVIATQRPSVDVITGTIKANIASRIAFAVSSQVDSRTIIDTAGADKLLGRGDMLFHPIDALKATRIQGCYVSEKEIEDVCNFWRRQERPFYVLNPIQIAVEEKEASMREEEDADPMWEDAVRFVVERGQASTSMLQRRFSIGFQRASRLLDLMEERGVVGARDGPRPREVLMDPIQMEQLFGRREFMTPMDPSEYIDEG